MRQTISWAVALGLAVSTGSSWGEDPVARGREIATNLHRANDGYLGEVAQMDMVLVNAEGDRIRRTLKLRNTEVTNDGDRSVIEFVSPTDVKGTRLLTWAHAERADDQWLYLPAIKRVKRISASNKSGSFMGSEFSYEDLGRQEVEKFTYRYLADAVVDSRAVWRVERQPVDATSGYTRMVVDYDKEYMQPVRIEFYDRKNELLKVATMTGFSKHERYYRAERVEMKNVQTGKSSYIETTGRKLNQALELKDFESSALSR